MDLPEDQSLADAGDIIAEAPLRPNLAPLGPDKDSLKPALDMLAKAKHPVLIAGLGVLWCDADAELVALAERLGAPVLTTAKCKGVIPADHPLTAGCVIGGLIERELVSGADLIVTIGLDPIELASKPWPYTAPVLSLASAPDLDAIVPASLEVIGDLKVMLARLAEWAADGSNWGETAARTFRESVVAALDVPSNGLSPQRVVEVARAVLPHDTVATCDAGASRLLVVQKWHSYGAHEFLTSNGLASMGYAIPGALAARLAYPDRPVVAFVGDGGFFMAVAELQTASRDDLPIIVVVFDDAEIGLIRVKQEIKGVEPFGMGLGGVDWEKIAQGFGCEGCVVETEKALGDALAVALKSGRTTVIAARIDGSGYLDQFNALREI
jgi:acetolactate synthase-1/2/3 large subunit